ncbi:hypothetical protein EDC04DRAFT_2630277, partial [Pisolithus marmoratus]
GSFLPAKTLLGPMTIGAALLIFPKCKRSPALLGSLGCDPPATAQPSGAGSALRSPPRLEPPRDILNCRWNA